ncbi:carboxylesterase 1-like [Melia azedarach]|uniref:Carboxylesterase 1-like n=1 Tax=Melia azedarach TaxID=155640 RepID=A0ACC1X3Y8_MELAZ|nr:carboxylesterase 1-like [Melia azedarach]
MIDHHPQKANMSNETALSLSNIDPYQYLQIIPNPDGTLTRDYSLFPSTAATPDPVDDIEVLSKDVTINQSSNLWVRIFLPRFQALEDSNSSSKKLPLIVYFHGGGFILFSSATSMTHDFCSDMANEFPAVIVSVEYRLAPENRLPAAYDDAMEALQWIKTTEEEWLTKNADISSCFLMGSSAGGNIAYNAGLRAAADVDNLLPLKIRGLILHSPFFSGAKRTESELRLEYNMYLPACVIDLMWKLSLPIGADRDHEYCNPTVGGGSKLLEQMQLLGWKVMVTGCEGDPLIDRETELAKIMKEKGLKVVSHFVEGGFHTVEVIDTSKTKPFVTVLKNFLLSSTMAPCEE